MPHSGHERTAFYFRELTYGTPPASWDASGVAFLCLEPSVDGLVADQLENMNYRQRALANYLLVRSLRNGQIGFGMYGRGSGVVTAEDANALSFELAEMLLNAWGGIDLGYATGLASGTAAAPVVDAGDGAQYVAGNWIFAYDASAAAGEFVVLDGVSTDTLDPRWPLTFTPDGGGADSAGAVIAAFLNTPALINSAHADHETHSFWFQGDNAGDLFEALGVKLNLTAIEGLAPGEAPRLNFEGMCRTFTDPATLNPLIEDTPAGNAPLSTATGAATTVKIGNAGSTMSIIAPNSYSITPGVASQRIRGLSSHGIIGNTLAQQSADTPLIEIAVPYDDTYFAEYEANTLKQLLIQVGNQRGQAFGIFAPRLQYAENPKRGVSDDIATINLKFRPLEHDAASAQSGNDLEQFRSKLVILMAA